MKVKSDSIELVEWEEGNPNQIPELAGICIDGGKDVQKMIDDLNETGKLEIYQLTNGLRIRAKQFVGRIKIGNFQITIRPKISNLSLLRLMRYAYNFRDLKPDFSASYNTESDTFHDILIWQLLKEADELIARGLHRKYVRRDEELSIPKGRINIQTIATKAGIVNSRLPCTYYPRLEDCLVNQILLSGLQFGTALTGDIDIRSRLRRLSMLLNDKVSSVKLDRHVFRKLHREKDRLIAAYEPAIKIIEILSCNEGISFDNGKTTFNLKGFLFDMNLFFQAILAKFLSENLQDYIVDKQRELKGMIAYLPKYNPQKLKAIEPKPDFIINKNSKVVSILDAKYKDIWNQELPPSMLYQLAIYALSRGIDKSSIIIYPTTAADAKEERIEIRVSGAGSLLVILRPLDLNKFEELISNSSKSRERRKYAQWLAFG